MDQPQTTIAARFTALVEAILDSSDADVGIAGKKGFGSSSLTVNGKIFAMLVKDRLVVKLPRERVDALIASGDGERFDPGHGRLMKEWASIELESKLGWLELANEAMTFVSAKR
jgi:TfoX/Sxy family transcriptional regulator of competence genes